MVGEMAFVKRKNNSANFLWLMYLNGKQIERQVGLA